MTSASGGRPILLASKFIYQRPMQLGVDHGPSLGCMKYRGKSVGEILKEGKKGKEREREAELRKFFLTTP